MSSGVSGGGWSTAVWYGVYECRGGCTVANEGVPHSVAIRWRTYILGKLLRGKVGVLGLLAGRYYDRSTNSVT